MSRVFLYFSERLAFHGFSTLWKYHHVLTLKVNILGVIILMCVFLLCWLDPSLPNTCSGFLLDIDLGFQIAPHVWKIWKPRVMCRFCWFASGSLYAHHVGHWCLCCAHCQVSAKNLFETNMTEQAKWDDEACQRWMGKNVFPVHLYPVLIRERHLLPWRPSNPLRSAGLVSDAPIT